MSLVELNMTENIHDSTGAQFRLEEGELVLSDTEPGGEEKWTESDNQGSRRNRRKQTFERRNIKKVREDALSEEAKAAQQAEMERRRRIQVKEGYDQTKFANIEFLLNDTFNITESCASTTGSGDGDSSNSSSYKLTSELPTKRLKLSPSGSTLNNGASVVNNGAGITGEYKDTVYSGAAHEAIATVATSSIHDTVKLDPDKDVSFKLTDDSKSHDVDVKFNPGATASASLFGSWSNRQLVARIGDSQDDAILLGDSDDDVDKAVYIPQSTQLESGESSVVIELSDGEDEGVDYDEGPEMEICELQDANNLANGDGEIVVNPNRDTELEPEIVLPPQITRIIKPHQVSGVRFLYDNVVESLQRFESTPGFGCILAHSMGLGKTIQIIAFLDILFRYCHATRVLLIVPINTIQNWQAEFELWLPTTPANEKIQPPPPDNKLSHDEEKAADISTSVSMLNPTVRLFNHIEWQQDQFKVTNGDADYKPLLSEEERKIPETVDHRNVLEEADSRLTVTSDGLTGTSIGNPEFSDKCQQKIETNNCSTADSHRSFRPFKLFVVRDIIKTMNQRHQIISQWFKEGGVLLLGYEMFRLLLNQKRSGGFSKADICSSGRKKKDICIDLEKAERLEQMWADFSRALLNPGPQLVICDEGHRIKNSEASISKALKAISTRRRVVLTGYPLQNNLMEYWCMVDFVRPSYLGTKQEFTNMFQRPIENGQCIDSTPQDRKIMQGRAHVLHDLLSGFVQRRSHAVLKASLPPKTEIVLLIKLSPLQRDLYAAFMRSLGSSGPCGWAQVNTLKTYAMCCKIWNHPDILWRAMEEHKEAMDFDIDDPTCSNSSTSSSNISRAGLHRSATAATALGGRQHRPKSSGGYNGDVYTPPLQSTAGFWLPQYTGTTDPTGLNPAITTNLPNQLSLGGVTSHPSIPAYLCGRQQQMFQSQATASSTTMNNNSNTYEWASDTSLWGDDYKPGVVEHSGKVLLFLSLLEDCILTGDKVLVFTQSLFTLDLLERILRRLPLPQAKSDDSREELAVTSRSEGPLTPDKLQEPSNNDESMILEAVGSQTVRDSEQRSQNHVEEEENVRSIHYRLASHLGRSGRRTVWTRNVHYFRLDGSTTASEREKLINNFNDVRNPSKLFLVSTRAGCLGVNLIGANRVIVFDASWNPCHDCQAVCRVYRYGQVKPCYIYRLVSDNTMERKIYDRQVTKQGMSDRVVDELNPSQQFTRSQVELLMSFEDKEMPSLSQEDLQSCDDLVKPDPVLASVLEKYRLWITKIPFTHESLLIDRKDYRLTRVEKRLARQRYEQEKQLSLSYQQAHLFQLQQMQALQQQQLLAAGFNPATAAALLDNSRYLSSRTPNILSRSGRPTYTSGTAALDAMRQVDIESRLRMLGKNVDEAGHRAGTYDVSRNPDCKVTRIVATSDLYFPSTTNTTTVQRKIPKGEVMEVIQTPKGKYLRIIRTGDLFVVKASAVNASEALPSTTKSELGTSPTFAATSPPSTSFPEAPQLNNNPGSCNDSNWRHSVMATTTRDSSEDRTFPTQSALETGMHFSSTDRLGSPPVSRTMTPSNTNPSFLENATKSNRSTDHIPTQQTFQPLFVPPQHVSSSQVQTPSVIQASKEAETVPHAMTAPFTNNLRCQYVDNSTNLSGMSNPRQQQHQHNVSSPRLDVTPPCNRMVTVYPPSQHAWRCSSCGSLSPASCTCRATSSNNGNDANLQNSMHPSATPAGNSSRDTMFSPPVDRSTNQPTDYYQQRSHVAGQQQPPEYLRAAEEVARQSAAAAAAYMNRLQQQQSLSSVNNSVSGSGVSQSSAANRQVSQVATGTAAVGSSSVPSPYPQVVLHDYFTQLAGQQQQQQQQLHQQQQPQLHHTQRQQQQFSSNFLPADVGSPSVAAAAMQHYLATGASGRSTMEPYPPTFPVRQILHQQQQQALHQPQQQTIDHQQQHMPATYAKVHPHSIPNFRFPHP